jgi:excisionase family DNA binding protein
MAPKKYKLVTIDKVQEATNIKQATLYRMAKHGRIPCYKSGVEGGRLLFAIDEVLQALRQPSVNEH